jgi:hypothetical protein
VYRNWGSQNKVSGRIKPGYEVSDMVQTVTDLSLIDTIQSMLTLFRGSKLRSTCDRTVKAAFTSWSNFQGRSSVAFTVYRTCPYSPSNDEGRQTGSIILNWKQCSPAGNTSVLPAKA